MGPIFGLCLSSKYRVHQMQSSTDGKIRRTLPQLSGIAAVILVGLAAGAVAQSFGRFTFGVLLPAIRDDLGLSNTVAGSLVTLNVAAYLVGTLIVATASSRYRLMTVMRLGMVLAVVGLLTAALSTGPLVLAAGLVLMGVGGSFTWIPAPIVAAAALGPERRGIAVGFVLSAMGAGVVFSGQLAGFVRSSMGDASWRSVYVVQSVIGIMVVGAALLFLSYSGDRPSAKSGFGGFSVLRRMPGWLPMTVMYATFGLMYLLVVAFLTTRLEDDSGWTSTQASLAFTLLGVAMIFGGPLFNAIAAKVGPRLSLVLGFSAWAATTTIILPGRLLPALAGAVAVGLLFSGLPTVIMAYVVVNTTTEDYGPSFAAATFAFGVAQMISPQIGGSIADAAGSFTPVFLLSAGLALVGVAAALRLPRTLRPTRA